MLPTALAGVVHDRQSAADYENNSGEDHQYRGFHCGLANAVPQSLPSRFSAVQNERTVNVRGRSTPLEERPNRK